MSGGGVVVLWLVGFVTLAIRAFSGPAKGDIGYGIKRLFVFLIAYVFVSAFAAVLGAGAK